MSEHMVQALFLTYHRAMKKTTVKTRFGDIARELTEGIGSGRYPIGSILPGELELCERYETSRHTVRAALHELQQLGLVSRKKNAGTRVESTVPKNDFRPSLGSLEDLVQFGTNNVRVIQSSAETVVRDELAKHLGLARNTHWLRISSLRVDSGNRRPIGWTDVYVDPRYAEIAQDARLEPDTLISTLIERRYGQRVAEIRQVIRAVGIPDATANALHVVPGTAGLEIVRQYLDAARHVFEASVTVHPSDRFAVAMRLERSKVQ